MKEQPTIRSINLSECLRQLHDKVCDNFTTIFATWALADSGLRNDYRSHPNGNRNHVRSLFQENVEN